MGRGFEDLRSLSQNFKINRQDKNFRRKLGRCMSTSNEEHEMR